MWIERLWPDLWRDLVLNGLVTSRLMPRPMRWRMLRWLGMDVEPCKISPGTWLGSRDIAIGDSTYLNYGVMIDGSGPVRIGRRCSLAMRVTLVTSTHDIGDSTLRAGDWRSAGITIGDGSWLGAGVTVLPGVSIGPGCVIAAGAVVTSDCEPDTLYAGVPARPVRQLTPA